MIGGSEKRPAAVLDYLFDFSRECRAGETISNSRWTHSPAGLELSNESFTERKTAVRIGGGIAGALYVVTCTITTSLGRVEQAAFELYILPEAS